MLEDFRTRPERVRLAKQIGGVLGVVLLGAFILLLAHGKPKPIGKVKKDPGPVAIDPRSAGVQDAFAYAKDLESKLRADAKFSRIYLVPSAANASQKQGKVMVMGEVASEADMESLRMLIRSGAVPVGLEWQVTVPETPG